MCRYDPLSWEYPSWASINGPAVNILKGALVASDRIVTVSQVPHSSLFEFKIDWLRDFCRVHACMQAQSIPLTTLSAGQAKGK